MKVTFENWDSGYVFYFNGKQVGAGLYNGTSGFELLEESGMSSHSNGMCAFGYLKAKYESNSIPLKQSTIDIFTPRKGSNPDSGEDQRAAAKSRVSSLKSTHPVLYPQDPELQNTDWTRPRSDQT